MNPLGSVEKRRRSVVQVGPVEVITEQSKHST